MNTTKQTKHSEDAKLLALFIAKQDEASFARLINKYKRLVWNVCCRILQNHSDIEDAFQETFVLLATRAHRIRKPKSLASWLYGAAFRTASSIRRKNKGGTLPIEDVVDSKSTTDVLERVAQKNERELVCLELHSLSEKFKTPLLMHYFIGETAGEIAQSLGLSVAAVESRLRRGRQTLRSRMLQRGFGTLSILGAISLGTQTCVANSLVNQTIGQCMTVSTGSIGVISNVFESVSQTGTKLMILKSLSALGITCVLGLGIAMHSTPNHEQAIALTTGPSTSLDSSVQLEQNNQPDDPGMIYRMLMHVHRIFGIHQERQLQDQDHDEQLHREELHERHMQHRHEQHQRHEHEEHLDHDHDEHETPGFDDHLHMLHDHLMELHGHGSDDDGDGHDHDDDDDHGHEG